MESVGLQQTTPAGKLLLAVCFAAMVLGGAALWATEALPLRVGAVGMWLVTAGMCLVLRRGGIVDDDDTAQQWKKYQQQLVQKKQEQQEGQGGQQPGPAASGA